MILLRCPSTGRTLFLQFLLRIRFSYCKIVGWGTRLSLFFTSPSVNWNAANMARYEMYCSVLVQLSLSRPSTPRGPRATQRISLYHPPHPLTVRWTDWSVRRRTIARTMCCLSFSSVCEMDFVRTTLHSYHKGRASARRAVRKRPSLVVYTCSSCSSPPLFFASLGCALADERGTLDENVHVVPDLVRTDACGRVFHVPRGVFRSNGCSTTFSSSFRFQRHVRSFWTRRIARFASRKTCVCGFTSPARARPPLLFASLLFRFKSRIDPGSVRSIVRFQRRRTGVSVRSERGPRRVHRPPPPWVCYRGGKKP